MLRVTHFEIPAQDPRKVSAFYAAVFDWQFSKWESGNQEYWLVMTGEDGEPGINGGLSAPNPEMPGIVNTIDVPDLDAYLRKVTANGGQIVAPKMPVPGIGWLAYCKDVEGTAFGLIQNDPTAGLA